MRGVWLVDEKNNRNNDVVGCFVSFMCVVCCVLCVVCCVLCVVLCCVVLCSASHLISSHHHLRNEKKLFDESEFGKV
jgi:hypothetical protein